MKYLLLLCIPIIVGCTSTELHTSSHGYDPVILAEAATVHRDATSVIDKEAKSIIKHAQVDNVKESAIIILAEEAKIAGTATMLNTTAKDVTRYRADILTLQEENTELKSSDQKWYRRMAAMAKVVGFIMIPVGLILAFKLGAEFIALSAFGILLIVTSSVVHIIEKYGIWIGGLTIVVIGVIMVRMYLRQHAALESAVHVGETLKQELKVSNPEVVDELFGTGVKPGLISQPSVIEKQIRGVRKRIDRVAAPVMSQS